MAWLWAASFLWAFSFGLIKGQLTADRVAAAFAHYLKGGVARYEMPGMDGFNFVLENVLNGGGSASLRYDPQAKTYGQMLLDIPIRVPAEWLAQGGPLAQTRPLAEPRGAAT